jgi:hypothetical protein
MGQQISALATKIQKHQQQQQQGGRQQQYAAPAVYGQQGVQVRHTFPQTRALPSGFTPSRACFGTVELGCRKGGTTAAGTDADLQPRQCLVEILELPPQATTEANDRSVC